MWFGTRDGLNKYDGSNITVFRNNPKDTLSICNNDILSIEGDKTGNIWVGTGVFGISKLERRSFRNNLGLI